MAHGKWTNSSKGEKVLKVFEAWGSASQPASVQSFTTNNNLPDTGPDPQPQQNAALQQMPSFLFYPYPTCLPFQNPECKFSPEGGLCSLFGLSQLYFFFPPSSFLSPNGFFISWESLAGLSFCSLLLGMIDYQTLPIWAITFQEHTWVHCLDNY